MESRKLSRDWGLTAAITEHKRKISTTFSSHELKDGLGAGAGAGAGQQSPGKITLQIKVRDVTFPIHCGAGEQNFKWLGMVTKFHYARRHSQWKFQSEQFVPVHMTTSDGTPLYPFEIINERVEHGATVLVELLGPKLSTNDPSYVREKTLWELYAYTPPQDYVPVVFLFDSTEFGNMRSPPGVFGNFNGWGQPLSMKRWKGEIWRHQIEFPADAEIVFQFVVNESKYVLSSTYAVVTDAAGRQLNYMQVRAPPTNYHELREDASKLPAEAEEAPTTAREDESQNTTVSNRIAGAFQGVKLMSDEMKRNQFENDWKQVQLADVINAADKRSACKDVFRKYFDQLRVIFRFYSSQGTRDIAYMNIMKFINFCHVCGIPDKRVTVNKLYRIFHRVNIEEVYDETKLADNSASVRNAMSIREDPFNPNNQFIRGEFYEALIRISIVKYPVMEPSAAVEKLITESVLPKAMEHATSDIRERLMDEDVQRVYAQYSKKLYKAFVHYAGLDKHDMKETGTNTINFKEYEQLLADFQLLDTDLSRRVALSSFAMSQEDASVEGGVHADDLYEMVYAEFLEVFARLADAKYAKDSKMTLAQRLQALFGFMFPATKEEKRARLEAKYAELERQKKEKEDKEKAERLEKKRLEQEIRERKEAERLAKEEAEREAAEAKKRGIRNYGRVQRPAGAGAAAAAGSARAPKT